MYLRRPDIGNKRRCPAGRVQRLGHLHQHYRQRYRQCRAQPYQVRDQVMTGNTHQRTDHMTADQVPGLRQRTVYNPIN